MTVDPGRVRCWSATERLDPAGLVALQIRRLRALLDSFESPAKTIVGSTREILNIVEWFEAGADIVTVLPALVEGMLVHPYSKETVQAFLRDGQRLTASLRKNLEPTSR